MEIINNPEKGSYLLFDDPDIGFGESIWYPTATELKKAIFWNKVAWKSWHSADFDLAVNPLDVEREVKFRVQPDSTDSDCRFPER